MPKVTSEQIAKRNQDTINFFVPQWLANARENMPVITRGMKNGQAAYKVPLNGKNLMDGIVVVASGPTLYEQREHLKELNKYFVIATPTNYGLCKAFGLHPDILAVADSNPEQAQDVFKILHHSRDTNIVASPTMPPQFNAFWPWTQMYWFKAYIQNKEGNFKTPYNFFIDHLFKDITDHIMQAGSVTNMCLILIELLRKMGRTSDIKSMPPIFLIGSDLCVGKSGYHRAFKYHETQTNFVQEPLYTYDKYPLIYIKEDDKITSTQMYNYRRSLFLLWLQVKWKLYNCSPHSLLSDYVPYVDINDVVRGNIPRNYDMSIRKEVWKKYEASPLPTTPDGKPYDIMNLTCAQPVTNGEVVGSGGEVTK
jgi:hypothetical protein